MGVEPALQSPFGTSLPLLPHLRANLEPAATGHRACPAPRCPELSLPLPAGIHPWKLRKTFSFAGRGPPKAALRPKLGLSSYFGV